VLSQDRLKKCSSHHDFLLEILFQKGEEQQKAFLRRAHDVALDQCETRSESGCLSFKKNPHQGNGTCKSPAANKPARVQPPSQRPSSRGCRRKVAPDGGERCAAVCMCDEQGNQRPTMQQASKRPKRTFLSEMRARSSTLRVCVAEKSIV
jgi:hypothetical protein